jgi:hypothetical protein
MSVIRGGYSSFSSGPIRDTTPKDPNVTPMCGIPITDALMTTSSYGPSYEIGADSVSEEPEHKEE